MLQVKELQKIFRVGGNEVAALGRPLSWKTGPPQFKRLPVSGEKYETLLRSKARSRVEPG